MKSWGVQSPCEATTQSKWWETLTECQTSTLVLHQFRALAADTPLIIHNGKAETKVKGFAKAGRKIPRIMVDLNNSIGRYSSSTHDDSNDVEIAPCILPQQLLWMHLYGNGLEPRPMIGIESMLFQGWPVLQVEREDWMDDRLFQSLAGNGVPLPILVALLSSAFEGISWVGPACERLENDEDDAIQSAIALLHGVQSSTGGLRPGSAIGGEIARPS